MLQTNHRKYPKIIRKMQKNFLKLRLLLIDANSKAMWMNGVKKKCDANLYKELQI